MKRINPRSALVFVYDVAAAAAAWLGAYLLRFNLELPPYYEKAAYHTLLWVVPLQAFMFWVFGLYQGIWRFASLPDLKRILKAIAVSAVAITVILIMFRVKRVVPRSVLILDPILLLLIMGGSRLAYRAWKEHRIAALFHPEAKPVLVLGAGSAADILLRDLSRNPSGYRVVGLLDDDPGKRQRHVQGMPVLGPLMQVEKWAKRMEVDDVIFAMPSTPHTLRKQMNDLCARCGLNVLTVPSVEDLMQGRISISTLRKLELDDLLGRDPVQLDAENLHRLLVNRVVLVTGAGGSIGSELCRQIARFKPKRLVLLEIGEFPLYRIEQEFRELYPAQSIACVIGDVKDVNRMREVMVDHRTEVVLHAAAYKHVPMMEGENALQALKNNVLGTWVVAHAAQDTGVEKFVMVSTDKAVNPTNIMGASKRLAEMVCQSIQDRDAGTCYISVRFGNVLGSSGSVIPKFRKQIESGGPVTVTHPEINRYFMSIPEAAQLVLQAGSMGQGGEIFVLDMGEPVKIVDLARLMIRLAGKSEEEIKIVYTGLRPGEKLYEELLADAETTLPTPHPKLRVAKARKADVDKVNDILTWIATTEVACGAVVQERLKAWLPEYQPAVWPLMAVPSTGVVVRSEVNSVH